jgi:tRNA (adenine37-N6)-methyltransferase
MSIVKLMKHEGNILTVQGVDMLDRTPLLDIKPYMPKFDSIDSATEGWTAGKEWRRKPEGRE